MDARKLAAQFAARMWYTEIRAVRPSQQELVRFANENWKAFLPVASEGLGKLLMQVKSPRGRQARGRAVRSPGLALPSKTRHPYPFSSGFADAIYASVTSARTHLTSQRSDQRLGPRPAADSCAPAGGRRPTSRRYR